MATSKLQRQVSALLSTHLGQYTIRENHRPQWLEGLELDFYIEELETGIEVQGRQHFEFSPMFHKSHADLLEQQNRDRRKMALCVAHNVGLYYIRYPARLMELLDCLNRVSQAHQERTGITPEPDAVLRTAKRHERYGKLYTKVCEAYRAQDIEKLKRLLERLEHLVAREYLHVSNKHLRRLIVFKQATRENAP